MTEQKPIKLAYVVAEPAGGCKPGLNPVILHHGMTRCKERWNPILQKLADNTERKVYAVDARNHGNSERSDHFLLDIMIKDFLHFMDTVGIQKAIIVGHSMGGWVAMGTALQAPERVETMIIEDSSPAPIIPDFVLAFQNVFREQQQCLEKSTPEDSEEAISQQLNECVYRSIPMIPDEQREVIEKTKYFLRKTDKGYEHHANMKVIIKYLDDPKNLIANFEGVYKGYLLFLIGEKSFVEVGKHKDLILKLFPDARFYEFVGAAHDILEQFPDSYFSTLCRFINGS